MVAEHWANALALNISAAAVLRCAFAFDVVVYTVMKRAISCRYIAGWTRAELRAGATMLQLAIHTELETSLDSSST